MTNKPSIGFIGLGLMGSAMVERMQKLGYPMTVVANRDRRVRRQPRPLARRHR